jgi:dTMP kinase
MKKGLFITFEGADGVGKTSVVSEIKCRLESIGQKVKLLHEPGSTDIGEQIRSILLNSDNSEMSAKCEILLYEAARAQMVNEVVLPLIEEGWVVLCDRFIDSTLAYQGYGRRLSHDSIEKLNEFASDGILPDRTVLLCADLENSLKRATLGGTDRLEAENHAFHSDVHRGFIEIAKKNPERIIVIDISSSVEATADEVYQKIKDLF